jgi:hypothetical protein
MPARRPRRQPIMGGIATSPASIEKKLNDLQNRRRAAIVQPISFLTPSPVIAPVEEHNADISILDLAEMCIECPSDGTLGEVSPKKRDPIATSTSLAASEAHVLAVHPNITLKRPRGRREDIASDPVQPTVPLHMGSLKYQAMQYIDLALEDTALQRYQANESMEPVGKDQKPNEDMSYRMMLEKAFQKPDHVLGPRGRLHSINKENHERVERKRLRLKASSGPQVQVIPEAPKTLEPEKREATTYSTFHALSSTPIFSQSVGQATLSMPSRRLYKSVRWDPAIITIGPAMSSTKQKSQAPVIPASASPKEKPQNDDFDIDAYVETLMNWKKGDKNKKMLEKLIKALRELDVGDDLKTMPVKNAIAIERTQSLDDADVKSESKKITGENAIIHKPQHLNPTVPEFKSLNLKENQVWAPTRQPRGPPSPIHQGFKNMRNVLKEKVPPLAPRQPAYPKAQQPFQKQGPPPTLVLPLSEIRKPLQEWAVPPFESRPEPIWINTGKAYPHKKIVIGYPAPPMQPVENVQHIQRVPQIRPARLPSSPPAPIGKPAQPIQPAQSIQKPAKKWIVWDDPEVKGREVTSFENWYAKMQLEEFTRKYPMTGQKAVVLPKKKVILPGSKHDALHRRTDKWVEETEAARIQRTLEELLLKKKEAKAMKAPEKFLERL